MGFQEVLWTIQNLPQSWRNIVDLLLVAAIFFFILKAVKGTRAATLLRGIGVVLTFVFLLSVLFNLQAFSWLLSRFLTGIAIALPVIFQDELRRWLDRLGRMLSSTASDDDVHNRDDLVSEITSAVKNLSRRRHGALIVIERETGLQEFAESGVPMNAAITSELLQTIFFPNTALHDGAVILRDDRIVAAACTLPISTVRKLPDQSMGLRHRAALGISEICDGVIVVVSEETGRISLVINGRFIRGLDPERLAMILKEYIEQKEQPAILTWIQQRLNRTT